MSTIVDPVLDRVQMIKDAAKDLQGGNEASETWDGSLQEGRNEFTLDIEGIDFHVVYDRASAQPATSSSETASGPRFANSEMEEMGVEIPMTRVERVDDEPAHGEVPGTEAHEMRKADARPDQLEVIPDDGAEQGAEGDSGGGGEGQASMSSIPMTRVERVDDEPAHGEVPGTEAHEMRKGDAVPDEMEVIPEELPSTRSTEKRPLVLLSHALMADLRMWDSTVKALNEEGYDCVRHDHIGHGGSGGTGRKSEEWQGRRWHFDDFTRHMKMIVDRVMPGEEPVAVVGCSMGGTLVMRYAMLFPPKEHGQLKVVCIGAPGLKSLEESRPKWEERKKVFRQEGVEVLARKTAERWFPQPVKEGVRERAEEMCKGCSLEGYEGCAEGIVDYQYDSDGEVEGLRNRKGVEVLVVRGENDEAVGPRSILEGVARRVGGRFVGMNGVGHLPPMHDEDGFEKLLLEFLRS